MQKKYLVIGWYFFHQAFKNLYGGIIISSIEKPLSFLQFKVTEELERIAQKIQIFRAWNGRSPLLVIFSKINIENIASGQRAGNCSTTNHGFFAAGDVSHTYMEQVWVAVGGGTKAALSAYEYLLPKL